MTDRRGRLLLAAIIFLFLGLLGTSYLAYNAARQQTQLGQTTFSGPLKVTNGITVSTGAVDFPDAGLDIVDLNDYATTVCSAGCDYSAIDTAVGNASAGDIVLVKSGSYTDEAITISKDLTLIGENDPVITATSSSTAITITAGTVRVQGLTVYGGAGEPALEVTGADTIVFDDLTVNAGAGSGGIAEPAVLHDPGSADTLYIYHSTFNGTDADAVDNLSGGTGFRTDLGSVYVYGSTFNGGKRTAGEGGDAGGKGIQVYGGEVYLYGSTVNGGQATGGGEGGSALYHLAGDVYVHNSYVAGGTSSSSDANGVGLQAASSNSLNVYNSRIEGGGNDGGTGGQGISASGSGTYTVYSSYITGVDAGVRAIPNGSFALYNSTIESIAAGNPALNAPYSSRQPLTLLNSTLVVTGTPTAALECGSGYDFVAGDVQANYAPVYEPGDCLVTLHGSGVQTLHGTLSNSDTSAKDIGVIPANADIIDATFAVETAFDGSGADNVDCGISGGDTDAYVDNLDVSSTGINRAGDAADMLETTTLGDVGGSDVTVQCVYTDGGGDSSAGSARLAIRYVTE